jgi:hypothetical protein
MNEINPVNETGFPHQAARGSWICALLIVVLIIAGGRIGSRLVVELLAFGMMCLGALLGAIALFGIPKYGCRGILGQAIAGLILNGLLLSIFATNFLAARAKAAATM